MSQPISTALVKYSPVHPLSMVKDFLLQKMEKTVAKVLADVKNLTVRYPEFIPYAFDIAMHMEKSGHKLVADQVRVLAIGIIKGSTPSPHVNDPHFLTPALFGIYPVGVKSFYIEDISRNEKDLGHGVDRTRRLEFNVYYPAEQNKKAAYKVDPNVQELAFPHSTNKEIFDNLWTRSQLDVQPLQQKKFPLVFFSHGWGQNHNEYQHLVEEWASHGYCVITINHPFSNFVTAHLGHAQDLHEQEVLETSDETYKSQKMVQNVLINAKDIAFILSQIQNKQIPAFELIFGKSIDPELVAVVGHSMGGAVALQLCKDMPSIKAGINLDGGLFGIKGKIAQPFLILGASKADAEKKEQWREFQQSNPLTLRSDIPHSIHEDFTMGPLYHSHGSGKTNDSHTAIAKATNNEILTFLNKFLIIHK